MTSDLRGSEGGIFQVGQRLSLVWNHEAEPWLPGDETEGSTGMSPGNSIPVPFKGGLMSLSRDLKAGSLNDFAVPCPTWILPTL